MRSGSTGQGQSLIHLPQQGLGNRVLLHQRKEGISVSTSTKFYILTIVLVLIAFSNIEALGLHPITVTCIIAAIVTAYLGGRTENA